LLSVCKVYVIETRGITIYNRIIVQFIVAPAKGEKIMLFAPKEKGQGLVEYALILVLIAVVVIVILALLGPAIGNIFSNIVSNI